MATYTLQRQASERAQAAGTFPETETKHDTGREEGRRSTPTVRSSLAYPEPGEVRSYSKRALALTTCATAACIALCSASSSM